MHLAKTKVKNQNDYHKSRKNSNTLSGGVHLNNSTYIILIFIILIVLSQQRMMTYIIQKKIIRKRKQEDKREMIELAKRFIDKDCIIRTFNNTFIGTIKEVSEGAILVENDSTAEIFNLEFVISIKEHPRNKKGKKKVFY